MGIACVKDTAYIRTALVGGLVNQQLANDPGGDRWRRLLPRVIGMLADDLGLPRAGLLHHQSRQPEGGTR